MRTRILLLMAFISFGALMTSVSAQIEKHQAAYIFNFTRFIKWPENQTSGNFVIGVLGKKHPIVAELKGSSSGRSVGSQSVVIEEYLTVDALKSCQILFVPDDLSSQLKKVAAKLAGTSTVVITEEDGWNPAEATINLHIVSDKLAFYINKSDADAKKIVISEKLMTLSK
jgi:hypothetical protein